MLVLFSTDDAKESLLEDIVELGFVDVKADADASAIVVGPTIVSVVVWTPDFLLNVRVTVVVATVVVDVRVVVD